MSDEQLDQTPNSGGPEEIGKEARTMALLAHLLGVLGCIGFIGPLIIWILKKDEDAFIADQAKEALNFQITVMIGYIACIPLSYVFCIGTILSPVLWVAQLVFAIMAGLKANEGVRYRYPYALRLIK